MTLPMNDFLRFEMPNSSDPYLEEVPSRKLDDLLPRRGGEGIRLSLMLSTFNRRSQLIRTLETLCRQTFKEFEVLINDDGSTQDVLSAIMQYTPYLRIQYFSTQRTSWRSCPSKAFKTMLPFVRGEVIAISHPEIMIDFGGIEFLYNGVIGNMQDREFICVTGKYPNGDARDANYSLYRWAALRPAFIDEPHYPFLDNVDWHSDLKNIQKMSGFLNFNALSGRTNLGTLQKTIYPWWLCGATTRDCPIWDSLPEFLGHGIIDRWLWGYREANNFVDTISTDFMCYHQPHARMAFAPEGELYENNQARKIE